MHGFEPGEIVPTTPLMLSHKHPDDRTRVDGILRRAAETGQPFSSVHRIIDAAGKTRVLAVTGQGRRDPATGKVTELFGYFVDVTKTQREASNRSNIAVRDIAYSLVPLFSGPDVTEFPTSEAIDGFLADPIRPDDL